MQGERPNPTQKQEGGKKENKRKSTRKGLEKGKKKRRENPSQYLTIAPMEGGEHGNRVCFKGGTTIKRKEEGPQNALKKKFCGGGEGKGHGGHWNDPITPLYRGGGGVANTVTQNKQSWGED